MAFRGALVWGDSGGSLSDESTEVPQDDDPESNILLSGAERDGYRDKVAPAAASTTKGKKGAGH